MDRLSVGMHVDIMRSDGRVHGALVTQLRHDTRVVSVEWFEKGETKGKEVDLAALMRNNQTLFQQSLLPSNIAAPPPPSVAAPAIEKTNAVNTRSRVSMPATKLINPAPPAVSKLNDTFSGMNSVENKPESRRTMVVGTRQENNNTSVLEGITSRKSTVATSRIPPVRPRVLANVPENTVVENKKEAEQPAMTPATEELIAPIPKSQVVSKIEEMEKSREQRRVQQTEAKKQREIQKNIDPGNPNWQFLSMIRDYQSQVDYKPLKMADAVVENRICVCVRKRPINKKEIAKKEIEVITIPNKDHMVVHQPQTKVDLTKYLDNQVFRYDYTFDENTTNEMVYKFTAQPLVRTIFQRGFATCFAYGQTGSGKTHTMGGVFEGGKGAQQDCTNGIYALTATDVFKMLNSADNRNEGLSASCSFFEIYGAKVFDLLGKKAKLRVLEDGKKLVQVVGLKEFKVHKTEDVLKLIRQGSEQRTAGQTSANSNSSRSHAVFQIILRKREGNNENLFGKFSLIDLAGNERGADTISSDRQTRLEGAEINKSLLALKECIRAMGRDEQHVPFRGSKLTLILRDSFIGKNAKVCMIAMISPGMSCVENSLNTLRYADRVKELGNENGMPTASPMSDDDFLVAPAAAVMTASQYEEEQEEIEEKAVRQRDRNMIDREYQQAVENMSKAEEKAIDEQQNLFEKLQKSIDTIANRLEETNMVDYDYETHARASIKEACDIINAASKCKATYEKFLEKIGEEQEISARYGRK